jgi:hypothetical protein
MSHCEEKIFIPIPGPGGSTGPTGQTGQTGPAGSAEQVFGNGSALVYFVGGSPTYTVNTDDLITWTYTAVNPSGDITYNFVQQGFDILSSGWYLITFGYANVETVGLKSFTLQFNGNPFYTITDTSLSAQSFTITINLPAGYINIKNTSSTPITFTDPNPLSNLTTIGFYLTVTRTS